VATETAASAPGLGSNQRTSRLQDGRSTFELPGVGGQAEYSPVTDLAPPEPAAAGVAVTLTAAELRAYREWAEGQVLGAKIAAAGADSLHRAFWRGEGARYRRLLTKLRAAEEGQGR
jgi:hypothetical protein